MSIPSTVPDWVLGLKTSIPDWVEAIRAPAGYGRYRFAIDAFEPFDLCSSECVYGIRRILDGGSDSFLSDDERSGWVTYLRDLQREDGMLIDPALDRRLVRTDERPIEESLLSMRAGHTRNGLQMLHALGGRPRYALRTPDIFVEPAGMIEYLEALDWQNPWGAGSWAGGSILKHWLSREFGEPGAGTAGTVVIGAGIDWLLRNQDPETGAWFRGDGVPVHNLINGIFKVWIQLAKPLSFPIQYPDKVIDLCIRGLRTDPMLGELADACSIFDVALVLDVALGETEHRREESAELVAGYLETLRKKVRPDGAFSYWDGPPFRAVSSVRLAPDTDQADALATALNMQSLLHVCRICGLSIGWASSHTR